MANASQKKIASANKRILNNLRKGFMVVNVTYILWRIVYHWSTFSTGVFAMYIISNGIALFLYSTMESTGRPRYDASGALISSGMDLNAEGLTAYMFDVIYITWAAQILTAFISNKFWYIYLVIPAYACYKVFPFLMTYLGSSGNSAAADEDGTKKSKRQAKLEKRGNQGRVKYVR